MRNLIISLFLLLGLQVSAQVETIKGRVVDSKTQSGIAYTNIGVEGTFYGTASDVQGFFELKIPDEFKKEKMFFSAVGYQNQTMDMGALLGETFSRVQLEEQTYSIENIDVAAQSRVLFRVLKSAAENIPKNNQQGPLGMKFYYEETMKNGTAPEQQREAVIELYDETGYTSPSLSDAFKSRHYRFSQVKKNFDSYSFPGGQTGFDELIEMDIARLSNAVLNVKLLNDFDLQLEGISQYEGDSAWIISYKTEETGLAHTGDFYASKLNGKIYISKNNYEVLRNECIVEADKNNPQNRSLATKSNAQNKVNYHFTAAYRKQNGKYALGYLDCKKTFVNDKGQESSYSRKASVLELNNSPQKISGKDYFENETYVANFWDSFKRPQ
jgi:hypothetical protein